MATPNTLILCMFIWMNPIGAQPIDSVLVEEYTIGSYQRATRIVASQQGTLYVLDSDQNLLFAYENGIKQTAKIGGFGWLGGSFDNPTGVASDGVNLYVSDYGNHRVQCFDRNLNYISSFSTRDTSNQAYRFGYPRDIALSEFGDLFILDGENLRVLKFTPSYFFERSFGDVNAGKGKLQNPVKLVATTSRIFIGEKNRIVIFDYFGNYLGSIGDGVISELNGFALIPQGLLAVSNKTLWIFLKDDNSIQSLPINRLISSERIEGIQDVAFDKKRLFILSLDKIHVFKLND